MSDIISQNFTQKMVEASRQVPVLVDFWAPWCGPCRTLDPMLEKLEVEYVSKQKPVKINLDENPELSAQFYVRNTPYMVALVDSKPVDRFAGMLPEAQLCVFLDRVIPQPAEVAYCEEFVASQAGEIALAREAFQNALAFDPGFDAARFALVNLLLSTSDAHAAQGESVLFSPKVPQDARYVPLETRLRATERADMLSDVGVLHAVVQTQPGSLQARLDLTQQYVAGQDYEAALKQLLAVVERNRVFRDDTARKTTISVSDMICNVPQAVSHWRRQFASKLN